MLKTLLAGLLGFLMAGCTSFRQLDDSVPAPSKDESIIILGVNDEHYHVMIWPGSIDGDGKFLPSLLRNATVGGKPRNGYLIGKANAGDVIAVTKVSYHSNPDSVVPDVGFAACTETQTMSIKVPSGKVIYLGDVRYRFLDRKLEVHYTDDIDKARRYVDVSFPALTGKVEHVQPDFVPVRKSCEGLYTPIPIYIGR